MRSTKTVVFAIGLLFGLRMGAQQGGLPPGTPVRFVGPAQAVPDSLEKIFSNLGPSTQAYSSGGWWVAGPTNTAGFTPQQFVALPFTPKADSHVKQVRVAVQYYGPGANQVDLSLYSDSNGGPGSLLAGPVTVTNLTQYPACCTLTVANFEPKVAVTGGQQYWVVANTPSSGAGSDFFGVWCVTVAPTVGIDTGSGWGAYHEAAAGAVYGTIP
jgi:hypothetical protein